MQTVGPRSPVAKSITVLIPWLLGAMSLLPFSGCSPYFAYLHPPSQKARLEQLARAAEAKPGGAKEAMAYARALEEKYTVAWHWEDNHPGELDKSHARRAAAVLTAAARVSSAPLELLEEKATVQANAELFEDALATRLNLLRMIPTDPDPHGVMTTNVNGRYLGDLSDAVKLTIKVRDLQAGIALCRTELARFAPPPASPAPLGGYGQVLDSCVGAVEAGQSGWLNAVGLFGWISTDVRERYVQWREEEIKNEDEAWQARIPQEEQAEEPNPCSGPCYLEYRRCLASERNNGGNCIGDLQGCVETCR